LFPPCGKAYLIEVAKQSRRSKGRVLKGAGKRPECRGFLTICQPIVGSCPDLGEEWSQKCYAQASDAGCLADTVAKLEQRGG
jgi:hypothetical protein